MKRLSAILLFVLIAFIPEAYPKSECNWNLIKTENNISVYTRKSNEGLDSTLGVMEVNVPVEVITQLVMDVENQVNWVDQFCEAKIIRNVDPLTNILYYCIDSPWPVDDRDSVVMGTVSFDQKTARVVVKASSICDASVPARKDRFRMTKLRSAWVLEPSLENRNKTKVYYVAKADPGLTLPDFLVNFVIKEQPLRTLKGMKKMFNNQKYIDTADKAFCKKDLDKIYKNQILLKDITISRKIDLVGNVLN